MEEQFLNQDNKTETNDNAFRSSLLNNDSRSLTLQAEERENIYAVFMNNKNLNDISEKNIISTSKYKWRNFLAKILMEQFSRLANVYFLIIAVLQSIKDLSYSGGSPIILIPLAFVVAINGLKDLFEDQKRKNSDKLENNSSCEIYHPINGFEKKRWRDIKLGDIVKVRNDSQFPCDLLLLSTNDENGICYVETKSLDGETNLKLKQVNETLHKKIYQNEKILSNLRYVCITKPANEFIYKFDATVYETEKNGNIVDRTKFLLMGYNSFLLRGCVLRQTEYIIGMAIFIGPNTKIMINSPILKSKVSTVEGGMNRQIIMIFLTQVVIACILSLFHNCIYRINFKYYQNIYYFDQTHKKRFISLFLQIAGTWITSCTNLVPISLLTTMETIKFIQGYFMSIDVDMMQKPCISGCKVNSSTLNEELGKIQYVFCDKTGTLTKNKMKYKMMSIGNDIYGTSDKSCKALLKDNYGEIQNVDYIDENNLLENNLNDKEKNNLINHFMLCLTLCNTVIIDTKKKDQTGLIDYQSSSPDEKALVYFARYKNYILSNRSIDNSVTLEIKGEIKKYLLLNTLEYSSERKRMSVIVKSPTGEILVYAKGADSMIEQLLCEEDKNSALLTSTNDFLKQFACKGLRTLMIAYKEITEEYYNNWNNKYETLVKDVNHQESDINKLYDEMENDFHVLGSTAIEDELQDDVDIIINSMIQTGMRVWMLTGDKLDTAKNIATSCKLFQNDMNIIEIRENQNKRSLKMQITSELKHIYDNLKNQNQNNQPSENDGNKNNLGLIIASGELVKIFTSNELLKLFHALCVNCLSVVCCRVSPKQKAQLVNLIKTTDKAITMSVGDGANDVGMITEANVGIGIEGVEGTQAARAADYSIKEFSHLKKLLFFHGREAYRRNTWIICYNFYKNAIFVSPMIYTGFTSLFTGDTIYDPWIHQFFNMLYALLPCVWYGIFNFEYTKEELLANPKYYIQGIYNLYFRLKNFIEFEGLGFLHGFLCYFLSNLWFKKGNSNGTTNDFYAVGTAIYAGVVMVANLKVVLDTSLHDVYSVSMIIFSVLSYYISVLACSSDYIFSESTTLGFYVLDNFSMIILDSKFLFYIIQISVLSYFIEIACEKFQILFGIEIEGKYLPPYKGNFDSKNELGLYFGNYQEELVNYNKNANNDGSDESQKLV